ncbi:hypothetical protein Y032_0084g1777 [Ancylostoma ceylanicum]|nr:hypothetical protein Y032_0084g1777 [Ancylostoma ceylanicum]
MKSKVHSEMEILEKNDKLITRYFQEARHVEDILGIKEDGEERDIWRRYSKERMKTVSVALVLCLHIGVIVFNCTSWTYFYCRRGSARFRAKADSTGSIGGMD